jgi:hypothetical protein
MSSSPEREMLLRRIENEMLRFIDDTVAVLNAGSYTLRQLKGFLRYIDLNLEERDGFEKDAPADLLSHVADAITRFETESRN